MACPEARREGLVVRELPDETLVYDLERDRAHCLNRAAALVWRHSDGQTPVARLAELVGRETGLPAHPAVVWLGLERLASTHLLLTSPGPPASPGRYTRRDVLRRLGLAGGLALLLPAVHSIVAPAAAQAASGVTSTACFQNPAANEGKCCVNSSPNRTCVRVFRWGFCLGDPC